MSAGDPLNPRHLLVVAAALIRPDGRLLVQQRPVGKQHAGLWELPGGKVEPGETPEEALVRELGEELGIEVDAGDLSAVTFASHAAAGNRHLILLLYRARRWRGEPRAIEAAGLCWSAPADLRALPMPPGDMAFVHSLAKG